MGERTKEKQREYYTRFRQTPKGRATVAWHHILRRCGGSDGQRCYANVEVRMTREEFVAWAIPEFVAWLEKTPVPTGDRKNGPSVDRIETSGHYEVGNLQIVSGGENRKRAVRKGVRIGKNATAPTGTQWCGKCQQYKELSAFPRRKGPAFGRHHQCKDCTWKVLGRVRMKEDSPKKQGPNARSPEGTKWCPRCESYKQHAEFYVAPSQSSGLSAYCKSCTTSYAKRWKTKQESL